MASDGCRLNELQLLNFRMKNIELSIVVPFSTPSEALGVGTWRSIFFFAFQISWPRLAVDWIKSLVDGCFDNFNPK